ncbi:MULTISPECIES: DNA cytosine methyltransferase [unclassified Bradyrhizobium]|uniref:DNA cytosine methyltransferase n=1 Tax=unclassified Bradyrhizobium TaxID=2631580 RepID=UPI0028E321BA|nr:MULTISPECIES: DNA cytosine methyltransferase [unclassified Bradyrhizobium]
MTRPERRNAVPTIQAVDLFCGVGGLTHGLIRGGITVVAGVDVDPACRHPYETNNDAAFFEEDIKGLQADRLKPLFGKGALTMMAGCAPCQPFSTYSRSGRKQRGGDDWELVGSFGRLVREVQPDFVTMENVPQVEQHPVFRDFLASLVGYQVTWKVIECSTLGVPQTRKRLVLLGSRHGAIDLRMPRLKSTKTVRETIGELPSLRAGESDGRDSLHVACRLSEINLRRIKASRPGGTWRDWKPSLRAACHRKETGDTYPSVYGRMEWDKPAPTITTQCFGYGNGRFGHPDQHRAITLREAAMLQTFPRNYEFVPKGAAVKFSQLGRLIGNAVPVRLGEVIARSFVAHAASIAET